MDYALTWSLQIKDQTMYLRFVTNLGLYEESFTNSMHLFPEIIDLTKKKTLYLTK